MRPPEKILIIRPSALGDVCRSVPVLVSLKRAFPEAQVDWLVQDSFRDAVSAHPDLHSVVPFDRRGMGRASRRGNLGPMWRLAGSLRRAGYHLVVDAQGLFRSGFFAGATGAERRIGYRNARELGWVFCNERHRVDRSMHSVDRMLALLERAGIEPVRQLRLFTPESGRAWVTRHHPELNEGGYVVLAPTSRWVAKQWPDARFAELCGALLERSVARVVLVGGPGEAAQCPTLGALGERDPRVLNLIGATGIDALMALIERCDLLVANDSAALHMGVGFERELVALYGPTRVDLVGPYRRDADVIQHVSPGDPMNHKIDANGSLMERIGVDEVLGACVRRLGPE
ncbi:MAG: glycosyltransferase family 9 protein [Phycisphaerales bacterium JB059]